ncbi:MAG: (Fe-S)-binding protein [Proteobacteria bacterium]|nr:(Fe-S)-binding protein [Pseudomonadota bacterium]
MTKQELLDKALSCNRCGTCRGVTQDAVPNADFSTQCPSGMTLFGEYEPAGLMYIARGIAQGDLQWNKDLANVLYSCTLCGYCEDLCSRGYRHTPAVTILEELRKIVPQELKPKSLQKAAAAAEVPKQHKLAVLKNHGVIDVSGSGTADTILFADTTLIANSSKLNEIGFLIKTSGKKLGCFIVEPLPPVEQALINGGQQDVLERCVARIDRRLKQKGIKKVVCYNPESLSVLKRFSRSGAPFVSITQLYAEMLKKKSPKKLKLSAVTYQDPCHLGRYAQEYIAPRQVIAGLGLTLKEMWRSRNNSLCCGAGGGLLASDPKRAKRYAANRWEEVSATGAKTLITACPYCNANFRQGKPKDSKIMDLTSLMAQAYGYTGKEAGK